MGKSVSKQRDIERKFTDERDRLFKEFFCAKKEIQRNFNRQRGELEKAFHIEIDKLYKIHQGQINTMKLQMRDSQLGDFHERWRGKLNRHLSWPIAESTPKQSHDTSLGESTGCGQSESGRSGQTVGIGEKEAKTTADWQILVQHLKFALNNQKALFENALLEEKLKMQKLIEAERAAMEESVFKRLNQTLQSALLERETFREESSKLQNISKTMMSDWVLINECKKRKSTRSRRYDSDSEEENSGDSGVEEKTTNGDKRGNYWRMKYMESQKKHSKRMKELEEEFKEKEKSLIEELSRTKCSLKDTHVKELNEVQTIAAKELQKSLREERQICKGAIKDLNEKLISMTSENEELKERIDELSYLLDTDVKDLNVELAEKLAILNRILSDKAVE